MAVTVPDRAPEPTTSRHPAWRGARLWLVVLPFAAVGLARSIQVDVPFRDPHGQYFTGRALQTAGICALFALVDAVIRSRRQLSPASVLRAVRSRWTPGRIAAAVTALLAYDLTYLTYRNLKSWDVFNTPRDDMLQRWDRWIFGGHSPAVLLHDALGTGVSAHVVMEWYASFAYVALLAFPALVALARRTKDAYVGFAALIWVWILGTATYYLIPSLGPFYSAPQDFTSLPAMSVQKTQAKYLAQREHLLAHPGAHDAFAQISAFASLHIGVTATIIGIAWWNRLRKTTIVLTIFLVGTMIATVYLGWHYAVDLPAGLLIAGLAWVLAPLTVGVRQRPVREPVPAE